MQKKIFIAVILPIFWAVQINAAEVKKNEPLRILCLGDSITQSDYNYCGYRYMLWKKMVDSGINFDFVGSIQHRFLGTGNEECLEYKGRKFDRDHEGHWGWRTDHILGITKEVPGGSGKGNLSEWLKGYTPDIVLLHLGHNDAGAMEPTDQIADELKKVIAILQKANPRVSILLAKVIPSMYQEWNEELSALNPEADGIAKAMTTKTSKILVIDLHKGFDAEKDTFDGIHPNQVGAEKMARKWFDGILRILNK